MTDWNSAGAAIAAAFHDPAEIHYEKGGATFGPLPVVRSDRSAPEFTGAGKTLRTIAYELAYGLLPTRPRNGETFRHRERIWQVTDVTDLDDVEAWELIVVDVGPA